MNVFPSSRPTHLSRLLSHACSRVRVMLSAGAVVRMFNNDTSGQPTVQLLDIKQIVGNAVGPSRYRLFISDGQHFMQAILSQQLNELAARRAAQPAAQQGRTCSGMGPHPLG